MLLSLLDNPFINILLLILGIGLLIKGADFFVDGASKVARAMKIPSLIIGLTLVSIGTSLPELSVSISASIKGMNDMSVGNVVGSNIFNTLVVIGGSALFTPMLIQKDMKKYDIPILIGIYILLILFTFIITPNTIQLWESIIIFSLTIFYTVFLIFRAKKQPVVEEEENDNGKWYFNLLFIVIGAAGIIFGGTITVDSAKRIALSLGMSELLVGLTIVAVGTSLPELVTSLVAAKKGENDIAVGNAIGSSLFNVVLILGLSGIIRPIGVELSSLVDILVMLFSVVLIFIMSFGKSTVDRKKGILLVLIYVLYLTYIILRNLQIF